MNVTRSCLAVTLGGILLLPAASSAQDDLAARERRAANRYAAATAMGERFGRYEEARRAYLDGGQGIQVQAEKWTADAREYVEGWVRLLGLADLQEDLSFDDFQAQLTSHLGEQTVRLGKLREALSALDAQEDRPARLTDRGAGVEGYPGLEEYGALIDGLAQREGELREALHEVVSQREALLHRVTKVDGPSRVIILARLREALLRTARYPLEQTMTAVKALLDAEAVADPVLADLDAARVAMGRYALRSMRFHAERDIAAARARCTDAKESLSKLQGPATYLQAVREQADVHCTTVERHYAAASTRLPTPAAAVKAYLTTERPKVKRICTTATAPAECEELAVIAGLSDAEIEAMSTSYLAFVELTFAKALEHAQAKGGQT